MVVLFLASGATQTGFGQTGTVRIWCTTAKPLLLQQQFMVKDILVKQHQVDSYSNITFSPSVGDMVAVKDYGAELGTINTVTIGRNGSKIN